MLSTRKSTGIFFFTATNLNWIPLLSGEENKNIVIESLRFLHNNKRVRVLGFVIMPNHIHLLWQILVPYKREDVQRDFLKYTAQQIRFNLIKSESPLLERIIVNAKDRKCQVWERNSLSFEIDNTVTFMQKLNYIHNNPLQQKWQLSIFPEDYYSSAQFYKNANSSFDFLTHFLEVF